MQTLFAILAITSYPAMDGGPVRAISMGHLVDRGAPRHCLDCTNANFQSRISENNHEPPSMLELAAA
jgi:hypothetical protein